MGVDLKISKDGVEVVLGRVSRYMNQFEKINREWDREDYATVVMDIANLVAYSPTSAEDLNHIQEVLKDLLDEIYRLGMREVLADLQDEGFELEAC